MSISTINKKRRSVYGVIFAFSVLIPAYLFATPSVKNSKPAAEASVMHWTVDGADREALVYIPENAKTDLTPVIFAYHGFGGSMQLFYDGHRFDKYWPEAIVVWPQGLDIPGGRFGGRDKPGWQLRAGTRGDCDLHFFDAMLKSLRESYKVDDKRIYATGHSNGGGFTYLLSAARGNVLAAVAPSAAPNVNIVKSLKPKATIQITGASDPIVDPAKQMDMFNTVRSINGCAPTGEAYATDATYYKSSTGNPVVLYKHSGGHVFPEEAIPVVIRFFKSVQLK